MNRLAGLACFAVACSVGCGGSSRSGPPTVVPREAVVTPLAPSGAGTSSADNPMALSDQPFGGERYGFVEATSGNGRYVALRRFEGTEEPQFGHHGEVMGGAELALVDLTDLSERPLAHVIDVAPGRRFFLLMEGDVPVLLDAAAGSFEVLRDVDLRPDGNACLEPRQATFSPLGTRMGWVLSGASAMRVRDLASGDEWTVTSDTVIWRGWPEDQGRGVVLAEIPTGSVGWPEQHTSCACRWCNRFAASFGYYGWGGPTFVLSRVDDTGVRAPSEVPGGERTWHGVDAAGCRIVPGDGDRGYSHGPWRRECP